ncbi:MAG: ATP-binding cassette domain-containing protein [Solirubrobacterales bacterium]|nr:ATP-binding cassette domain-containing protein [Solirubrobacterales bacterium]
MTEPRGSALGHRLAERDLTAAPDALNLLESSASADSADRQDLLKATSPAVLGHEPAGHVVGITGPPGAGKSTLISVLVRELRAADRSVAVIAVDPSSKRSGGSLLGDRARIDFDPADKNLLIRSMATGDRLGGLARPTRDAAAALSAAYDVVIVETVGVGQSETEIADIADTVCVVVQPASGDALQFIKSGIMEIPDVLVVTKADLGQIAQRARRDLHAALRSLGATKTSVVAVSSVPPASGISDLIDAVDAHGESVDLVTERAARRRAQALTEFAEEHGRKGMTALGGRRAAVKEVKTLDPTLDVPQMVAELLRRAES